MSKRRTVVQFDPADKETDLFVDTLWREFARWKGGKSEEEIALRLREMKLLTWEHIVATGKEERYEQYRPAGR